ncbi:NAD(P)-binding protein [Atractiella rhizophila]|nr:NAD(P)-binding protein [Atractiella rhizophila]
MKLTKSRAISSFQLGSLQCNLRPTNFARCVSTRARAVAYTSPGDPTTVLECRTFDLPSPSKGQVKIRFLSSPINPADINVIQGVYPIRPPANELLSRTKVGTNGSGAVFHAGNEGVAVIEENFSEDSSLQEGDWVVMGSPQMGTWMSHALVSPQDIIRLPSTRIKEQAAATLMVNPCSAYRMLKDFVAVKHGDWVMQNGANSAVGEMVLQLARIWGLRTINTIRSRPDDELKNLKERLYRLGGKEAHVFTYDQVLDKSSFKEQLRDLARSSDISLLLNCVGGKETTELAKGLSYGATMVTYGGMAKSPLSLPPSLYIFKGLVSQGFWLHKWSTSVDPAERKKMVYELAEMFESGDLEQPMCITLELGMDEEEEIVSRKVREAVRDNMKGGQGKKTLLKWVKMTENGCGWIGILTCNYNMGM